MNIAQKEIEEIYVVEGYTDVLRLVQEGITNVVGICGTAFTDDHANMLKHYKKIILALDGDEPGLTKMDEIRDKLPQSVGVIIPEANDPDSYIRNNGLDVFLKLPHLDDLGWAIRRNKFYQREEVAIQFINTIANQSLLTHEKYLQYLAQASKIDYSDLKQELIRVKNRRAWTVLDTIMKTKEQITSLEVSLNIKQ